MKKGDFFLVVGALLLAFFLVVVGNEVKEEKSALKVVISDDKNTYEKSISYDLYFDFVNQYGRNEIEISGGKVRVVNADCKGQDCVNKGEISRVGEAIVCLPHKLTITITE